MKIRHGMILAAGLGKRMQPLTSKKPKPLLEIGGITLLERAINPVSYTHLRAHETV